MRCGLGRMTVFATLATIGPTSRLGGTMTDLTPEVVSLVHHVELSESTWWHETTRRMVLAALLRAEEALSAPQVKSRIASDFGIRYDQSSVDIAIARLESDSLVIGVAGSRFVPSQDARKRSESDVVEFRALEAQVERTFNGAVGEECGPMADSPSWTDFRDGCLLPLISQQGAQATVFSVGGATANATHAEVVSEFVNRHDPDGTAGLAACVHRFLGGGQTAVREYILRELDAQFIVSAAGLDEETVAALTAAKADRLVLRLVLDTNFIFSVLGWHDHPSNEAAQAVLDIAKTVNGNVSIELLVLPTTIEETENAICLKAEKLEAIRWTKSLADAALEFGVGGFAAQYLQSQAVNNFGLSITEYADLVSHDLETRLQSLGVHMVYEDISDYSMRSDVLDSIKDQLDFEEKTRAVGDRRDYQLIKHDMMAYHWIADQRPAQLKTAVEAGYWLVTLDSRLLGFDRYRCRGRARALVCLNPTTAVQFLQFWAPSSERLRSALFSSVQQPLFPAASLAETERVTFKIIERLGTLSGIDDVSAEAIRNTLADRVLQRRMRAASQEEELEAVEEAFVRLASEKERALVVEKQRTLQLEKDLEDSIHEIQERDRFEEGRKKQVAKLKHQVEAAATATRELEGDLLRKDKDLKELETRALAAEEEASRAKWRWSAIVLPAIVVGFLVLAGCIALISLLEGAAKWVSVSLFVALGLLTWLRWASAATSAAEGVQASDFAKRLVGTDRWIWWAIGGFALSFAASVAWDVVKERFGLFAS